MHENSSTSSVGKDSEESAAARPETPAPVTRGSELLDRTLAPRFDWYEFTCHTHFDLAQVLAVALTATVRIRRGRLGYVLGQEVVRDERVLATILTHGPRPDEVHVVVSGGACDELVPMLRRIISEHSVSRADSAIDFRGDWETVKAAAIAVAERKSIYWRLLSDSKGGETLYIGAASSDSQVRIYRKGMERRAHGVPDDEAPADWTRCELQYRPGKAARKVWAGHHDAGELWGVSRGASAVLTAVTGLTVERVSLRSDEQSDLASRIDWLAKAGRRTMRELADDIGTEPALWMLAELWGLPGA